MRTAYLDTLYELANKDKRVYALISDNGAIVYDKYREDLPSQYLNLGISEANMLGMAAGMASRGTIPFACRSRMLKSLGQGQEWFTAHWARPIILRKT